MKKQTRIMENKEIKYDTIKEAILHKINTKELLMRPKLYFTIKVAAIIILALSVLLISVFIINFILFGIRINSHEMLLDFGPRGWGVFLRFFPWLLLLLDIVLIIILETLVRNFKFGYKIPALYLLLGLLASIGFLGFVIDRGTDVNDRLLVQSDMHRDHPPFMGIYGSARRAVTPGSGLCLCTVESIIDDTIVVRDTRSTTTLVLTINDEAPYATSTGLQVGDTVFVAGEVRDGVVKAFGVKKVPSRGSQLPQ
jgi:hypothetical protein